jgi:hypothetical protein
MSSSSNLRVKFLKEEGGLLRTFSVKNPSRQSSDKAEKRNHDKTFEDVTYDYLSSIEPFFSRIPELLLSANKDHIFETTFRVRPFIEDIGHLVEETSKEDVFEIDPAHLETFYRAFEAIRNRAKVSNRLPGFFFMALVSVYDAMISDLIQVFSRDKPHRVINQDKEIKFKDVCDFREISDILNFYTEQVIEKILFDSRLNQIGWILDKIGQRLDSQHWPLKDDRLLLLKIIEIGERRNIYTHNAGKASRKYLTTLRENDIKTDLTLGELASISSKYYVESVDALFEFGIKLINIIWRYSDMQTEEADGALNQICYGLITKRRYPLAARLASFALDIKGNKAVRTDKQRKMLTINLANAYALANEQKLSEEALLREDWSSMSDYFRVCLEAVKANAIEVSRIMKRMGSEGEITKDCYTEWPVFIHVRDSDIFKETYRDVFKEEYKPFIPPRFHTDRMRDFFKKTSRSTDSSPSEGKGTLAIEDPE